MGSIHLILGLVSLASSNIICYNSNSSLIDIINFGPLHIIASLTIERDFHAPLVRSKKVHRFLDKLGATFLCSLTMTQEAGGFQLLELQISVH